MQNFQTRGELKWLPKTSLSVIFNEILSISHVCIAFLNYAKTLGKQGPIKDKGYFSF